MKKWDIRVVEKSVKLHNPIMIEGLPGIGNVGKVALDFMIDELNAVKLYEIYSTAFPHSVFVNEDNLVELPKIEVYYKKFNGKRSDLLLLAGDVQPIDEASSYEFSDMMLELLQKHKGKEVITLGGIGLAEVPKNPKVYCTGNSQKIIKKYKTNIALNNLHGVVGPILGVSGLMIGLASQRKLTSIAFLAETFGHPMYLGVNGAKAILHVLNTSLSLKLDLVKLNKEIKDIEKEMGSKAEKLNKMMQMQTGVKKPGESSYIG